MILERSARNPILTRADIPAVDPLLSDATSVFNPGAVRYRNKDVLLLRVQSSEPRTGDISHACGERGRRAF